MFVDYMTSIAPDCVTVKVTPLHGGEGYVCPVTLPAYKAAEAGFTKAFGKKPLAVRRGGSIPIICDFEQILGAKNGAPGTDVDELAKAFSGVDVADPNNPTKETTNPSEFLSVIDAAITDIASRITDLGAAQNRLESAITAIDTNVMQLTNSRGTMRDADIAEESTSYISAQILQSAASTLLATANQMPSVAVNLI